MSRIAVLVALWCALWPTSAAALAVDLEEDLALRVAQVSANEGALWNRRVMDLVWQVTEANGGEDPGGWLRRHSPRVHGDRECRGGNCLWSPHLDREGDWFPALACPEDWWRLRVQPIWLDLIAQADWLVAGGAYDPPCSHPPRTWGGPMDVERAALQRPPLYPMSCDSPLNDGFARFWIGGELPGGFTP